MNTRKYVQRAESPAINGTGQQTNCQEKLRTIIKTSGLKSIPTRNYYR